MVSNGAQIAGLPIQATDIAAKWDYLYLFLVGLSVFFFILVVGGMIVFAYKYRQSASPKSKYIVDNHFLEAFWTVIPTILLMVIFAWGWSVYKAMVQAPVDSYEVRVIGKQWLWQFQYDDGRTTVGDLYVPVNKPVKLVMTSDDVIHSFFVPNFRIKQDVVPGMYTTVWFEANIPGQHQVFCTEYCGTAHSEMLAKIFVLDDAQWKAFKKGEKIVGIPVVGVGGVPMPKTETKLQGATLSPLALQGKTLTQSKGCVACHSDDGTTKVGPSFKGLYGRNVELVDGKKVKADDNYIRESIENPNAKVVKGFSPVMPTFKGLLKEEEMNALITYIKSLKE